eukprot:3450403-Pleurochrysis_carterae.AAC.3
MPTETLQIAVTSQKGQDTQKHLHQSRRKTTHPQATAKSCTLSLPNPLRTAADRVQIHFRRTCARRAQRCRRRGGGEAPHGGCSQEHRHSASGARTLASRSWDQRTTMVGSQKFGTGTFGIATTKL